MLSNHPIDILSVKLKEKLCLKGSILLIKNVSQQILMFFLRLVYKNFIVLKI